MKAKWFVTTSDEASEPFAHVCFYHLVTLRRCGKLVDTCTLEVLIEGRDSPLGSLSFPAYEITLKDLRILIECEVGSFSAPYVFTSRSVPVGLRQEPHLYADEFAPLVVVRYVALFPPLRTANLLRAENQWAPSHTSCALFASSRLYVSTEFKNCP